MIGFGHGERERLKRRAGSAWRLAGGSFRPITRPLAAELRRRGLTGTGQEPIGRLIAVTRAHLEGREKTDEITSASAICQDLLIFGIDVEDYVEVLEREFGEVIWQIPWLRFTDQTASFRGWGCLVFPLWLLWRLVRWPFAGGPIVPRPDPRNYAERLTLEHIAAVVEAGRWLEPGGDAH